MKSVWMRTLAFAGLALCVAIPASAADLNVVSNVTAGNKTVTSTTYMTPEQQRTTDGQMDTIVEYGPGKMTMIDHKKREYWVTTFAEMAEQFNKLAAEMDGNPIMKKLMGGNVGAVEVTKGAGSRTIAGHMCDQYILSLGDSMTMTLWAARDIQVPAHYADAMKAPYAAMGPMGERFNRLFDEMKKIKGYPLSTELSFKMMGRKSETLTEATEVQQGPIPAETFAIPAGYKLKKSPFAK
jgi:hypothetical protein